MNKWFETNNLASYAKTALAQAQKKIDQVLDIKEEEIINGTTAGGQSTPQSSSNAKQTLESRSTSSITGGATKSGAADVAIADEGDSFFSTFLNQTAPTLSANLTTATTTLLAKNSSSNLLNLSPASSLISASDSDNTLKAPASSNINVEDLENTSTSATSSTATLDGMRPQRSKNQAKKNKNTAARHQSQSEMNEQLEKQNWIQSYVDSSIETIDKSGSVLVESKTSVNTSLVEELPSPSSDGYGQVNLSDENSLPTEKNQQKNAQSFSEIDFIKIDGNGSSASSASIEEGPETCASSDIEVISLPSTHGDQRSFKAGKVPSLASMASKQTGKLKSAALTSQQEQQKAKNNIKLVKSPPPPQSNDPNDSNNIQSNNTTSSITNIMTPSSTLSSISDMKAVLDAREAHILKLNKQNVKLQEDNDNLLSDIEKLKQDVNDKCSFYQRTANELSQKFEMANNERESLRKSTNEMQQELNEVKQLLKEKELQSEQLVQEGLKLSKQELNQSNIIKKLRAKEKETEEVLNGLKSEHSKAQKELEELRRVLDAKEEMESKNMDAFKKLEKTAVTLEKELANTKSALEDSDEKVKSLENTLQNTFKELAELHKTNAAKETQLNYATSSLESQIKEEIQQAVDKERALGNKVQESLKWELQSARADLTRIEQQHALREDMLRKEISDLQQQLRDSEMRNNELSQNISAATRPLLRQIENLQASHSSQTEMLENAERNLIERLKEAQTNICDLTEKNRQNQETLIDLTQQNKTFEAQLQTLRLEKSKLNAEYQIAKSTLETYENEKLEKDAKNQAQIVSLNQQVENLNKERKYLENQLQTEKTKSESDAKKFQSLLNEYNAERELLLQQRQAQALNEKLLQSGTSSPVRPLPLEKSSESTRFDFALNSSNGAINVLETLQSKLKQKDGEISQLQKEIQNLERIRESMAKELVNLSNKLDTLQQQLKEYPQLQEKYNKLLVEYNALLTMYGEKTEETEELRMDLQDMKEMYKLQIEDLLKRSTV